MGLNLRVRHKCPRYSHTLNSPSTTAHRPATFKWWLTTPAEQASLPHSLLLCMPSACHTLLCRNLGTCHFMCRYWQELVTNIPVAWSDHFIEAPMRCVSCRLIPLHLHTARRDSGSPCLLLHCLHQPRWHPSPLHHPLHPGS